jgi:hypothetical protein
MGLRCTVAVRVIVDKRVWGMAAVGSAAPDPLPPDAEARIGDFADLFATAIANAATPAELVASRAHRQQRAMKRAAVWNAACMTGAQQRLVSLGLQLRVAEEAVPPNSISSEAGGLEHLRPKMRASRSGRSPAEIGI